ncbi:SDR family NAD(P)-dependent oxidoreductase [Rhodococcus sp. W8901]|uniref:SDR family NAD(P)-dependent oxidoreductase n=1 Tax=Rhodococcus sp. W8901 TaxID=2742603 RepID=UPI0020C6D9E4|nr:SDR family NAD(P)-dependent oxidoreductase [Rhodococcus sp. W8901]
MTLDVRAVQLRDLEGSVAVVTGGARGIGAAIAKRLAAAGVDVAIWDAPEWNDPPLGYALGDEADLRDIETEVRAHGRRAHAIAIDVRDPDAVESAVAETVSALGGLDILVCAAGVRSAVPVAEMTDVQWESVVDTNLHGAYHCIRSSLAHLESSGSGRVVIVAAEEGRRGAAGLSHYAAAAWGLIGLAKSLALESAEFGLAVNVLAPGPVDTTMSRTSDFWALAQAGRAGNDPVGEVNEESARSALELIHPSRSAYVSIESICDAAMFVIGATGLDMTGSVLDVSAGLAATNTA